jgi:hypothetical protein
MNPAAPGRLRIPAMSWRRGCGAVTKADKHSLPGVICIFISIHKGGNESRAA